MGRCLDLLIDGESGLWHLSNHTEISWFELARLAARRQGLNIHLLEARAAADLPYKAPRPAYSVLNSERGCMMPHLDEAMSRYIRDVKIPASSTVSK